MRHRTYPWLMITVITILTAYGCAGTQLDYSTLIPDRPQPAVPSEVPLGKPRTIYVDRSIAQSTCDTYHVSLRRCGAGKELAVDDLQQAADLAMPGDLVLVRAGRFLRQFVPRRSGQPGAPITYRAYPGEEVRITGIDEPALLLKQKHHLVIEGFYVEEVIGWARLEDSAFNVIRGNRFSEAKARGTTGGLKLVRSHYNRILDNRFHRGNDSLVVQESNGNLIEDNDFVWGRHSLVSIRCGNFNVVRNNRFHNERQKAMEIYDCQAVSDAPYRLDATKLNLIEGNHFTYSRGPSQPHKYNAIQYSGQMGIVRQNLFYNNRGGGINFAVYGDEALYNYGHRVYHNTFYANLCYGLIGPRPSGGALVADNLAVNNLFYKNRGCRDEPEQLWIRDDWNLKLMNNAVLPPLLNPGFVSAAELDLRLSNQSPMIDTGGFLTRTIMAGSGKSLPVADVLFFYPGNGMESESGDLIRLAGSGERARVIGVDHKNQRLLLDEPLSWHKDQGVSLDYHGEAPDMGALESSQAE